MVTFGVKSSLRVRRLVGSCYTKAYAGKKRFSAKKEDEAEEEGEEEGEEEEEEEEEEEHIIAIVNVRLYFQYNNSK